MTLPNGDILEGGFPTVDWFNAFATHVDFRDKTVLDIGCATASYGVEAMNRGAAFYTGVELEQGNAHSAADFMLAAGHKDFQIWNTCAEGWTDHHKHDIVIFSMIIHWLQDAEYQVKQLAEMATDKVVFVYRHQHPGGTEPGYRPTVEELGVLIDAPLVHTEILLNNGPQYQVLAIYDKNV